MRHLAYDFQVVGIIDEKKLIIIGRSTCTGKASDKIVFYRIFKGIRGIFAVFSVERSIVHHINNLLQFFVRLLFKIQGKKAPSR